MEKSKVFISFIEVIEYTDKFPTGDTLFIKTEDINSFRENWINNFHIIHPVLNEDYCVEHIGLFKEGKLFRGTYGGESSIYLKISNDHLTVLDAKIGGQPRRFFSKLSVEDFKRACEFPEGMDKYLKDIFHPEESDRFELMDL